MNEGLREWHSGRPEWVIGLLGSTSRFQPMMRQAAASQGWIGERGEWDSRHPPSAPFWRVVDGDHSPLSAIGTAVSESIGSTATPSCRSFFLGLSGFVCGAVFGSGHRVSCTCMWLEFRVRRELNPPPLPPRSSTTSPAPPVSWPLLSPPFDSFGA